MKTFVCFPRQWSAAVLASVVTLSTGAFTVNAQSTNSSGRSSSTTSSASTGQSGNMSNQMASLMQPMQTMLQKMQSAKKTGNPDMDFATLVKIHHQGEIDLANQEVSNGQDQRLVTMARMQAAQKKNEISSVDKMMRDLQGGSANADFQRKSQQKLDEMAKKMGNMNSMMSGQATGSGANSDASTPGTVSGSTLSANTPGGATSGTTAVTGTDQGTVTNTNVAGTSGSGTSGSGAMGGYDQHWAMVMIQHHQDGIDMAKSYLQYGKDPELRSFAELLVANSQDEIRMMRELGGR